MERKQRGSSRKKWLALGVVAAVLLVTLVSILLGTDSLRTDWLLGIKKKVANRTPVESKSSFEAKLSKKSRPTFGLKVNVPLMLEAVETRVPEDKKDLRYKMTVTTLKALGLQWFQLFLYPDPKNSLAPVILVKVSDRRNLESLLNPNGPLGHTVESLGEGVYRVKKEAFPDAQKNKFPVDLYRIWLVDQGAVIGPRSLFNSGRVLEQSVLKSKVARLAGSVETDQDLLVLALTVPKDIDQGWEKKIQAHPVLAENPQVAMISAMGGRIAAQMTEPLRQVESLALTFKFSGDRGRTLRYAQQFRRSVDGAKVYRGLKSGNLENLAVEGMVLDLVKLIEDERFDSKVKFNDNKLALEFNWSEKDDQIIFAALSQATIGHLLAQSMAIEPTDGEIETQYIHEPELVSSVNIKQLEQQIPRSFQRSLFPGHFWDFGDEPHMTLELDTVELPNSTLTEATYEVLATTSPEGKSIQRKVEQSFKQMIRPGSVSPGNITVPLQKGIAAESLGKAEIRFSLSLPVELQMVEFNAKDSVGRVKKSKGLQVRLEQLEKDVVRVSFMGGKQGKIFAYDKSGRPLASTESMNSSASIATRFKGLIDRIKVVVAMEILDYPFEVDVDLNRGKELTLRREPEKPPRVRYDYQPVSNYVNFTEQELADLKVKWIEGGKMSWSDSLSISLPKGPFKGESDWEVHFFAQDKPLLLSGTSMWSSKSVSFSLDKGALAKTSAAFGLVQLNLATDIKRLTFDKEDKGGLVERVLPSGQRIKVTFNKNQIACTTGKIPVIQFMAYDSEGRRLKHDNYTEGRGSGEWLAYFWGEPTRLVMDLSTRRIEKTIPFDHQKRPVDQSAYRKFRRDIEVQREIVKTLKNIGRIKNRYFFTYGDDLAGYYYLHNKKKEPMRLIDRQVAHSDPAGVKRFGYKLKPYKGYYFTVFAGKVANGAEEDYRRQTKKKTYTWQQGTFTTLPLAQAPDIVAIPEDKDQPTFFLQWNQVYMKQLNGKKLKYLPQDYYSSGWVEAKFMGT
ncbi:MAG: hypothetical protein P8075_13315 [Deltaproteobacteria bacterium]